MLRLLPFVLIPILLIAGLGYFRFVAIKHSITPAQTTQVDSAPVEVPKTLPNATIDDRVKSLEDTVNKLASQVNLLKSSPQPSSQSDLQASVTDLKARVSALEKATPAPAAAATTTFTSKPIVYIPLGSGGQINSSSDWVSLDTFQATVDPSSYPGYSSMQLEVNMRLNQPGGTLYAKLYSSGAIDSSQVSSTSTSSTLVTSGNFTLSGSKTYTLQAKSSAGTQAFIDNARIKVNF